MNEEFFEAAADGDLARVQKMLAGGDARLTDADQDGSTALLCALPTLIWLLREGDARITEEDSEGHSVSWLLRSVTQRRASGY
jgi:hypothetical protein